MSSSSALFVLLPVILGIGYWLMSKDCCCSSLKYPHCNDWLVCPEIPPLCRATRAQGSDGSRCLRSGSRNRLHGGQQVGTRDGVRARVVWTHLQTTVLPLRVFRQPFHPLRIFRQPIHPLYIFRQPIHPLRIFRQPFHPLHIFRLPIHPLRIFRPPIHPLRIFRPPFHPLRIFRQPIHPLRIFRLPFHPLRIFKTTNPPTSHL